MNESFWDAHGVEIEAWANFFNQREWEVDGLTIKFGDLRKKWKIECSGGRPGGVPGPRGGRGAGGHGEARGSSGTP